MAAPPKPWERLGDVNHRQPNYQPDQTPSFISTSPYMVPGNGGGGGMGSPLPPLPPRPTSTMTSYNTYPRPAYSGYGTMGMYGSGMYGGTYRGYGQYGMGGLPDLPDDNGFLQIAENSSRQAFQSIESIVHAFGSVSMMLESTYHAVYSTFRAVLGVADHFNRMKSHFAQIFSALAIVRTLRWLYHRLLYLIGLRSQDPSLESVWRNASSSLPGASQQITESDIKASKSSWPIVLFLGVVFGGPYLIWRLLSSLVPTKSKAQGWIKGQEEHYAAVAQYPFQAKTRNELSFVTGQQLILAPKDQQPSIQGWLLASNGNSAGLVPANYIKIIGLRPPQPQQGNTQKGQKGNPMVASRIPIIPSPQLGIRPPVPQHTVPYARNFEAQSGTPHIQQRPPTTSQQGAPLTTWQRAPVTTWQRAPLTQQGIPQIPWQRPPLTTQQGAPLTTQQGAPLITQQGAPLTTQQGAPLTTQQGTPLTTQQGAPLTTQQGASLTTQQEAPLTTQQGAPLTLQQGAPLTTQQGEPLATQQRTPKSSPSSPTLTQPATPLTSHSSPLPPQNTPPFIPESLDGAALPETSPQMDGGTFNIDEPDGTNGNDDLEE